MQQEAIDKLAALAKLEMSEEERKTLPGQIVSIVEYIDKLRELELPADAPEMAYAVDVVNTWREDEAVNVSEDDRRLLIDAFPERVGDLNAVPAVFSSRAVPRSPTRPSKASSRGHGSVVSDRDEAL